MGAEPLGTSPDLDAHIDKRRKLRKGTRSCWECKRRKVKCTFAAEIDTVCLPCRRRKAKCVSQIFPDDVEFAQVGEEERAKDGDDVELNERMAKIERLVERLSDHAKVNDGCLGPSTEIEGLPTPAYSDEQSAPTPDVQGNVAWAAIMPTIPRNVLGSERLRSISQALLDAFPKREDANQICDVVRNSTDLFFQMNTKPRHRLEDGTVIAYNGGLSRPNPGMHPVLLAKRMLVVALCLQHLWPNLPDLSEDARKIMHRMANAAVNLVNLNEEFLGSVEMLECIILEGLFKCNSGNLRQAWLSSRRALSAAQLMGLHRRKQPRLKYLDPTNTIDPHFTWFRLVYADRMLCLLLGLPQSVSSPYVPHDIGDTSTSRFERTHAIVAGRILERNERDPGQDNYTVTEAIDTQMLEAAEKVPSQFWLPVNYSGMREGSPEVFWESMRFVDQFHHYLLLVQLHLPYLCSQSNDSLIGSGRADAQQIAYSKLACANAGREILTRFVAFRSFNHLTACCRSGDFVALVGAMALLLAHLDSHRTKCGNLLKHQRLGDRAMMLQVLDNMDCLAKHNGDTMTTESAGLLRKLLEVEAEAAAGPTHTPSTATTLELSIPYLGNVLVTRSGITSVHTSSRPSTPLSRQAQDASNIPLPHAIMGGQSGSVHVANFDFFNEVRRPFPPPGSIDTNVVDEQVIDPQLAAGMDDWAFQGVDTAFFDSLMRGTNAVGLGGDASGGLSWDFGAGE
ncbi:hypothetical protein BDV96DRAFT_579851 [Lophiotrema nucula]|uniref:Zn(2)-C6 fungal-type domain-containing protein n=1 Tax=Lophiotrema nucula TaxID=690887 RepID=A0A6A5Z0E2_9PLEO|nr:hypothetical protein BDV96DRAFT_579851 [Lophiotrema nucula]